MKLHLIEVIRYKESRYAELFIAVSFIVFAAIGILLIIAGKAYQYNSLEWPWFLLCCFCYIVLHEIIHVITMKIFAEGKLSISFCFPTISVGSEAVFSKGKFIAIALAPVVSLSLVLFLLLLFSSKQYSLLFSVLMTLNFASSTGDFLQVLVIRKYPAGTYFQDDSSQTFVYKKAE